MKVWILYEDTGDSWFPPRLVAVFATRELAIAERDRLDPGPFEDDDDMDDPMRQYHVREYDVIEVG